MGAWTAAVAPCVPDPAPVGAGSVLAAPCGVPGTHPADDAALGDAAADDGVEVPWVLPGLVCATPGVALPAVGAELPSVVCVPWPSVPAPPCFGPFPSCRTVLLAWMIAWRNGCTPSETVAMTAI